MKTKSLLIALVYCLSGLSLTAKAQTSNWTIDKAHSEVGFVVRHLGVSNVRGSFGNVTGTIALDDKDITKSKVTASIDITTVNTGVSARDAALKSDQFFDVTKYPSMTFQSTSITNKAGKLQLTGDLTLHGVTKAVTLDMEGPSAPQKGAKGVIVSGFSASGILKRSDFGITSYGTMVGDEVKFTIDLEIDKQP